MSSREVSDDPFSNDDGKIFSASRRVKVLIEKVNENYELFCQNVDRDMECAEKALCEIMNVRQSLKQKMLDDRKIIKSQLETIAMFTEPIIFGSTKYGWN